VLVFPVVVVGIVSVTVFVVFGCGGGEECVVAGGAGLATV
jgi:hypothetical protein